MNMVKQPVNRTQGRFPARMWIARAVLAALAAALAACGSGAGGAPASPSRPPMRVAPVAAGRILFVRERCGDCHALAAVGARGAGGGPDFDTSEQLTRAQLRAALVEGANGMPSYAGRLSPRQLDALAAFLFAATRRPRDGRGTLR